jgi:hypothetical protein
MLILRKDLKVRILNANIKKNGIASTDSYDKTYTSNSKFHCTTKHLNIFKD